MIFAGMLLPAIPPYPFLDNLTLIWMTMQDLKKALPNISRPDNSLEFELHANTSLLKTQWIREHRTVLP